MRQIKFSHDYTKLPKNWGGKEAILWGAYVVDIDKLSIEFIKRDTKYRGEEGYYKLNFKKGIVLHFTIQNYDSFTTIRPYTYQKWNYYCGCLEKVFKLKRVEARTI